jgi:virulence-associated protein VagC
MKARLVRIGNSRGVRLPKAVIEQAGLTEEVDLEVRGSTVVIAATGKHAVRFNANRPSVTQVSTLTTGGDRATYELISLPLYLAANVGRILGDGELRPRKR